MAIQYQTFPIEFRGGLISNLSPLQQGVNAVGSATVLQNLEPSTSGGYSKVKGFAKFDTSALPGSGDVLLSKVLGPGFVLAARADGGVTKYYESQGSGWTLKGTAASLGQRVRFVDIVFGGKKKTILVDGVNFPAIYNDTDNTFTLLSSSNSADIATASDVENFKNHIFYASDDKVVFSVDFDETNFSTASGAGVINVGSDVEGLKVFRDQLIIFTKNSIFKLVGNSQADFQLAPIALGIGCTAKETIQEVGGDVMYLSSDGIRLLSATDRIGDFGLAVASSTIKKDTESFLKLANNFSSLVIREKSQYRIFGYNASTPSDLSPGLLATKFSSQGADSIAWATLVGMKVNVSDSLIAGNSETIVFANDSGYVYKMEFGSSFDSENIRSIYESPYMPIQDPQIRKTFYRVTTYVEPTATLNLDINLSYDFAGQGKGTTIDPPTSTLVSTAGAVSLYGSPTSEYGVSKYGSFADRVYETFALGSGKTVSIRYEDDSTNPTFKLDTAVLEFRTNERQ